jgi:UPF0755 protein
LEENHLSDFPARVGIWRRKWMMWVTIMVCVVLLCIAGLGWWAYVQFQPPQATGTKIDFVVKPGESVRDISTDLRQEGLIRNEFLFREYVSYQHAGADFQVGHYELTRGMGIAEIVLQLSRGRVADETVTVTIPEGYTVNQIAQRMEDKNICTKADFLKAVNSDRFDEPFLKQLSANAQVKVRLEGYLFPDTYQFKPDEQAHKVVDAMLKDFSDRVNSQVMAQIQSTGKTLPQVITEASIVEKEAKVDSERPLIASVIVNRLKRKMPLQMDCTLQYILGHQEIVTDKATQVSDPYNTYRIIGLPPGPIASPGMSSILATITPAHTDYLYYVVKNDGTGTDYFAKTYAEQLHNEALSQQNLKAHSHG